ncbi:trypsin-like peptidase domain-containing protein [Micromonospora aurantiaca]|uniref:trypsin-like peptidase domain-containing protein n=1 Tax=Micromonospora aurantiaca (nom. illeg.) TaxID=47850 RepID=UPI0033FBB8E0
MVESIPAIGGVCPDADNPSARQLIGTAFAISATAVLTAFHCIGDRDSGSVKYERVNIWFRDEFLPATVIDKVPELDVAVLELEKRLPEGLRPVQLTRDVPRGASFASRGWPTARSFNDHHFSISGEIVDSDCQIFAAAPAIQLYCLQAATFPLHGFSGAPVLIGDSDQAAAGVIRWNPQRDESPDLAAGGTLYATPVSAILERSTHLQSLVDQLSVAMADDPQNGYCISHSRDDLEVARWMGSVLREEGFGVRVRGEYIFAGMNFIPPLEAAHQKYPDTLLVLSPTTLKCDSPSHLAELDWMKSGEIPGKVIPVRVKSAKMPDFVFDIEPIDLRGYASEEEIRLALIEGLATSRQPALPAPRFPVERMIDKRLTALSRSRLSPVTLGGNRRIEGGA